MSGSRNNQKEFIQDLSGFNIIHHEVEQTLNSPSQAEEYTSDDHDAEDIIANTLHAVADTSSIAHMGGIHLKGPLLYVGAAAELASEIIHDHSEGLTEKIICGTAVTLVKESINMAVAEGACIVAGTASAAATTPFGAAVIAGTVGTAVYVATKNVTDPLGHIASNLCHDAFDSMRNKSVVNRELIEAAKIGDINKISALLKEGANPNTIDGCYFNYTPLHWAAAYGYKSVVELLLESGAHLNSQALCGHGIPLNVSRANPNNQQMQSYLTNYQNKLNRELIDAAKINDVSKVVTLVKKGANPNSTDGCYFNYTPLMWASGHNFPKIVAFLLNNGANPNARSATGYSALDIAYTNPNTTQVRISLSATGGKAIQTELEQESARQRAEAAQQNPRMDKGDNASQNGLFGTSQRAYDCLKTVNYSTGREAPDHYCRSRGSNDDFTHYSSCPSGNISYK